jgi:DNA-binding transcriptional regulator YiaG
VLLAGNGVPIGTPFGKGIAAPAGHSSDIFESQDIGFVSMSRNGKSSVSRNGKSTVTKVRRDLRLTPEQFAELLGCSRSSVYAWENGKAPKGLHKILIDGFAADLRKIPERPSTLSGLHVAIEHAMRILVDPYARLSQVLRILERRARPRKLRHRRRPR